GRGFDRCLIGLVNVKAEGFGRRRVDIGARAKRVTANVCPGEVRFDAGRGFCNKRDRAGRGDRRNLIVTRSQRDITRDAYVLVKELFIRFAVRLKFRERAFGAAELEACEPGFAADKSHYLFHQLHRIVRTVSYAETQAEICKAHDAEPDRTRSLYDIIDRRQWEVSRIDDVVEETRADMRDASERFPIDVTAAVIERLVEFCNIDRS